MIKNRRHFLSTNERTRARAAVRALRLEEQLRDIGHGATPTSTTFGDWWEKYKKSYLALQPVTTRRSYAWVVERVLPQWRDRPLHTILPSECAAYKATLAKKVSKGSVRLAQAVLHRIFAAAVKDRLLAENPWEGLEVEKGEVRKRVLSRDEQLAVMDRLTQEEQDLFLAFLGSGLRRSEMALLKPESLQGHGLIVEGKREKTREVPLQPNVEVIFKRVLARRGNRKVAWLYERLMAVTTELGIPPLTLHDLRRTFGTRCATAGMPVPTLAKIMGHSDSTMTLKYYIHIDRQSAAEAMARVDLGIPSDIKPLRVVDRTDRGFGAHEKDPSGGDTDVHS